MKIIFFTLLLSIMSFACSGNCFACHQELEQDIQNDKNHVIILECINCHKDVEVSSMSDSQCAGDCFACHSPDKLAKTQILAHKEIVKCKECHLQKYENRDKRDLFFGDEPQDDFMFNRLKEQR